MKNYKTPELDIVMIAKIGDIITYSLQSSNLASVDEDVNGDIRMWGEANS